LLGNSVDYGVVLELDMIDKGIIMDLIRNCRVSYETLARRYNLAANSIKTRIEKLLESGVIQRFNVELSLAMIDAELMLALISTEGLVNEEAFTEKIANNPVVLQVGFLPSSICVVFAEYIGSQGLSDLGLFFRGLDRVKEVEIHTLLVERGGKAELTKLKLKVLRCLTQDARMPVSEIAERTRLTARRVRKVLDQFLDDEVVRFTLRADYNAGEDTAFLAIIHWNQKNAKHGDVVEWLQTEFPKELSHFFISASEPTVFGMFVVEHLRKAEGIARRMRGVSFIESVEVLTLYPARKSPGLREGLLERMLTEAGL